ncbi:MAG TPA: hypothetical protein VMV23_09405 [Candidatus Nanopelagicaceae bacterium]|nr:hypothetical protein [Candidatus Nanopelagicaceae bacterium]
MQRQPTFAATAEIAFAVAAKAITTTFTDPPVTELTVAMLVGMVSAEFCTVTMAAPWSMLLSPVTIAPVPVMAA